MIIVLTEKKSESVTVNVLMVILTFHVENAMYDFVSTKTETVLVHTNFLFVSYKKVFLIRKFRIKTVS